MNIIKRKKRAKKAKKNVNVRKACRKYDESPKLDKERAYYQ